MFVVQDNKLTTVVVWVGAIVILLLLGLLGVMGGILYSKKQNDVQMNDVVPGLSVEAEQPKTTAKTQVAVARPVQQPVSSAPTVANAPIAQKSQPAVEGAPRAKQAPKGKVIYVLVNRQLVPLALNEINKLAQEDRYVHEMQVAQERVRQLESNRQQIRVNQQTAQHVIAHSTGVNGEQLQTVDGNKVVLTQAKYGRGLQSRLQMMGMAAADLIERKNKHEKVVQVLEKEAKEGKREMRFIRVKPGDSLWSIAVRAYGDGFKYTKILEANPQLRNPDKLKVGTLLQVPM